MYVSYICVYVCMYLCVWYMCICYVLVCVCMRGACYVCVYCVSCVCGVLWCGVCMWVCVCVRVVGFGCVCVCVCVCVRVCVGAASFAGGAERWFYGVIGFSWYLLLSNIVLGCLASLWTSRAYEFISNNHVSFRLWWKENLINYQKVSKYYEDDCRWNLNGENLLLLTSNIVFRQLARILATLRNAQRKKYNIFDSADPTLDRRSSLY